MHNDTQIHGHEVIQMMIESGANHSRDSLRAAIQGRFGTDARFYTCSAEGLTADGLIDFLAERGKFVPSPTEFTIDPTKVCHHDE